jgi:pilus assembly protein CpaE
MSEKILIVDDDVDTLRLVGLMLQKQGYQILAASNGPQGLELAFAEQPSLILLDVMMPGMDGYEVTRNLRANEKTASTPILMFTAKSQLDDKVTGFEAGVDDYLTKPTHPSELHAHVKALLARANANRARTAVPSTPIEEPGYVLGVLAVRGGFGVSTVTLNLASALEKKTSSGIILAEFRPGFGTLVNDLNLPDATGLTNLLSNPHNEITRQKVRDALIKHGSGLQILAASPRPRDCNQLEHVQQFEAIINRIRFINRFAIIDLGSGLPTHTQKLVQQCSELLVVVEPFETSLGQSQALIEDLISLGVEKSRITVVANYRVRSDAQLSVQQIQDKLNYPIAVAFTPAPELLLQAFRRHTSAIFLQSDGLTAQQYNGLAAKIEARAPKPQPKS